MEQSKHLLKNANKIAERRRAEPGDQHPYRKVHMQCKECGKPIMVRQKNVNPDGNWCRDHRSKIPGWREKIKKAAQNRSQDWRALKSKQNKENAQKPEWKEAVKNGCAIRDQDPEYRKRVSAGLQGIPIEEWKGFTHYLPYCEKFNNDFKERVRSFQGYRCALCGHIWKPGEVKLTVHHVHNHKGSCCDNGAPRIFVCLCSRGCHHKTIRNWRKYVERFMRYIIKNFNGKCYYTKEEMEGIRAKRGDGIKYICS